MLVQRRRDSRAALRLMRKLLKKQGSTPEAAGHRQAALVCLGVPPITADVPSRTGAETEQSGREFSSGGTTARAQVAALQIGQIRPTFPEHARSGPQYFQPSTPPDLPIDPADLQSRGSGAMVRRCRSRMRPDQPIPPFDPTPVTVTKPLAQLISRRDAADPSSQYHDLYQRFLHSTAGRRPVLRF